MKKLLLFLLLSIGLNAQFNYQAIVKDSNGNVLTNSQVKFKFTLMEVTSTSTPVYVEVHTITTPQSGVVNLSIGAGDVSSASFSGIDWSNSVYVKEELDTGSGYEDMGTRQFASVPVAEYAKRVAGLNTISSTITLDSSISSFNTTGVVSATSFRGNADQTTLTYSGTVTNVLAVISDLQAKISELKVLVNSLTSISNTSTTTLIAYESFDYDAGTPLYGYDGGYGWYDPWDNTYDDQSWFSDSNKHYVINSNSNYGGVYTSSRRSDMTYEGIQSVGNYLGNDDQQTDVACYSFRVLQNSISSGIHYVQFIVQFNNFSDSDASGAANNHFILKNGEDEKLVVRRKDGNIFLAKSKTSSLEADIVDTGVALKGSSEAQFIILQINHTDSITKIWVDPILNDFNYISPPTADAYLDYIFDFNTILLASQTKWDFGVPTLFDEIRVMKIE